MKISTNAPLSAFLARNWIAVLIVLLVMFLLPKLLNLYALILSRMRELVETFTGAPGKVLEGVGKGLESLQDAIATPGVSVAATLAISLIVPRPVRWALWAWQALDLVKGDEQLTVTRRTTPTTPVISPNSDFSF